jgi:WD40 repeat protein
MWVAFSPNGKVLASAALDRTIKLWDVRTGKVTATLRGHTGPADSLCFSPDGKTLASASSDDNSIRIWDVQSGNNTSTLTARFGLFTCVAFSPDGKTLVSGGSDEQVRLWDTATYKQHLCVPTGAMLNPNSVCFTPDGGPLAAVNKLQTLTIWRRGGGKKWVAETGAGTPAIGRAFRPDCKAYAAGFGDQVKVWEVDSGKGLGTFKAPGNVTSLAYSPAGKLLAAGTYSKNGDDIIVWLVDAATGKEITRFKGHSKNKNVTCVAFSPDGKTLASSSVDGTIILWDLTGLKRPGK